MAYQEDWQKDLIWQKMQAAKAEQHRVSGDVLGEYGLGKNPQAMPQQPQTEQTREVHQAIRELDFALGRLTEAVAELDHRTSEVQIPDCPTTAAECKPQRALPDSHIAKSIALSAIAILDQVERLEGMNRRIQL